jgi:hypothetical protein
LALLGKQKSGCLIAKLAAGFLGVPLTEINYTQLVITCQLGIASASLSYGRASRLGVVVKLVIGAQPRLAVSPAYFDVGLKSSRPFEAQGKQECLCYLGKDCSTPDKAGERKSGCNRIAAQRRR